MRSRLRMVALLDEPAYFACRYASVELARRAMQRIHSKLSANTGVYCTSALIDEVPVVVAVTLTERGRRRLSGAPWGGEPYDLDDELREVLNARLSQIHHEVGAGARPLDGYMRRGASAGVELRPDGTTEPLNRPQG
jgi:hypothetical protein